MPRAWLLSLGLITLTSGALATEDVGKLLEQRLGSENSAQAEQEQAALAKQARLAGQTEGEQVLSDLARLKTLIQDWDNQISPLLTQEAGKVIASNATTVKQFIQLYETPRMNLLQAESVEKQVVELLDPVRNPRNPLYTPSEDWLNTVRNQGNAVRDALKQYARLQTRLNLLLKAPAGYAASPGTPTLKEAMDVYLEEEAKLDLAHMQDSEQKAREDARKDVENRYSALLPSNEEETYLRQQAARQNIQAQFAPFLQKGYTQIGLRHCHEPFRWKKVNRLTAVSYGGMIKCQTLDNAENFIRDAAHKENDRPKWAPPGKRNDAAWEQLDKKLELFKKLAPIWVEMKLLAE